MPPKRRKFGTIVGLVIYVAFLAAATAWFAFCEFPKAPDEQTASDADPAGPERRSTGTITMPGGPDGACRLMKFDNSTGSLQAAGVAKCRETAPGANSTEGRMNAIRDAFSRR